jgi:nucleoside 2-deoxyribosyltransferase
MNYKVYLAGPIYGLSWDGASSWREEATRFLREYGIQGLSPLRAKDYLKDEEKLAHHYGDIHPLSSPKGLTTRDRNDVRTSDLVIAYLKGADVASMGTCVEFGWADAWRKPIIMVADEGDLHEQHGMLSEIAGYKVPVLGDAVELAAAILGAERQRKPGEIYAA